MIIYISESKLDNLSEEMKIRKKSLKNFLCKMPIITSINVNSIGFKLSEKCNSLASEQYSQIMEYLKKSGKFKILTPDLELEEEFYYECEGELIYNGISEGNTRKLYLESNSNPSKIILNMFFADDILKFTLIIDHKSFSEMQLLCSARFMYGLSPVSFPLRILEETKEVKFYEKVTGTKNIFDHPNKVYSLVLTQQINAGTKQLHGSPVIILTK